MHHPARHLHQEIRRHGKGDPGCRGSGTAKVQASHTLTVRITGAGTVLYAGNPTIELTITGTGSVRKLA